MTVQEQYKAICDFVDGLKLRKDYSDNLKGKARDIETAMKIAARNSGSIVKSISEFVVSAGGTRQQGDELLTLVVQFAVATVEQALDDVINKGGVNL